MAEKTVIDEIEVRDLEDNSTLRVTVYSHPELGNRGVPGVQVLYMGQFVNYEPLQVERWAYQAQKAGTDVWYLADQSWAVHEDQFVKNSLVLGTPLKARVEVKTRSKAKPVVREYELPFALED
jgi:hypothetical protein